MSRDRQLITSKLGNIFGMSSSSRLANRMRSMLVSLYHSSYYTKLMFVAHNPWNEDAGTLHNDAWPLQLAFHSFDPVMAITDDADNVW